MLRPGKNKEHGTDKKAKAAAAARAAAARSAGGGAQKGGAATQSRRSLAERLDVAGGREGAILFGLVFLVYATTLFPTVPGGDSGELMVEAYQFGQAHPPGYPLFTLAMGLWANYLFPVGRVAWRMNVLAGLFAAGAAGAIFLAVVEAVSGGRGRRVVLQAHETAAAACAAALFAFSPLIWMYATQAEVFSLNNLFVALFLYLTIRYYARRELTTALVGALVAGMGLTNQHTLVLYLVPSILFILYFGRTQLVYTATEHTHVVDGSRSYTYRPSVRLVHLGLCFLAGLSFYAYLPWASARVTKASWGDCSNVSGFLIHLLRQEYGTFQLHADDARNEDTVERLRYYMHDLAYVQSPLALATPLLAAVGLATAAVRRLPATGALAFAYGFYMVVFHALANLPLSDPLRYGVHQRFWMQPNVLVHIWLGIGLITVARAVGQRAVVAVAAALAVAQVALHYGEMDMSGNRVTELFARSAMDELPANSFAIMHGDTITNGPRYLHQVEQWRPDIVFWSGEMATYEWWKRHHHHYPGVTFPNEMYHPYRRDGFSVKDLLDANYARFRRRIFTCIGFKHDDPTPFDTYTELPFGACNLVVRKDDFPPFDEYYWASKRVMDQLAEQLLTADHASVFMRDTWEYHTVVRQIDRVVEYGLILAQYPVGPSYKDNTTVLDLGREQLELAVRSAERMAHVLPVERRVGTFRNLALMFYWHPDIFTNKPGAGELRRQAHKHFSTWLEMGKDLSSEIMSSRETIESAVAVLAQHGFA